MRTPLQSYILESAQILMEKDKKEFTDERDFYKEREQVISVLENTNSPVTRKYHEKLFQSVIDKKHINFGSIEKSKGRIKDYEGYQNMIEILDILEKLAIEEHSDIVLKYVKAVQKAIQYIESLANVYEEGFRSKSDYVILEYNTYVYTTIEATTTLLYEFIEYVKRPDMTTMKITLKNNKTRANLFYFEQLEKFNNVNDKMGIEYRKMLENLCEKGRNKFIGVDEIIGITAISIVALAIVPITRELIYQFYRLRGNISTSLEMQAKFLEMNKICLEANTVMNPKDKTEIIQKQKKLASFLRKLSEKIKVKNAVSVRSTKQELAKQNKMLSIDKLQDEVSLSPLEII